MRVMTYFTDSYLLIFDLLIDRICGNHFLLDIPQKKFSHFSKARKKIKEISRVWETPIVNLFFFKFVVLSFIKTEIEFSIKKTWKLEKRTKTRVSDPLASQVTTLDGQLFIFSR